MTTEEAKAFLRRFEEVNQFEIEEMKRTSLREKLHQFVGMMGLAIKLSSRGHQEAEIASIRHRWLRLRERLVG